MNDTTPASTGIRVGRAAPAAAWLDLPRGVRFKVRPLTSALFEIAMAHAQIEIEDLVGHQKGIEAAGGRVEGLDDLVDPAVRHGKGRELAALYLALEAVEAWEGVIGPDDAPAPVTEAYVREIFENDPLVARTFYDKYLAEYERWHAEGNASAPSPNGTSAGALVTAGAAGTRKSPARRDKGAATASSAPTGATSPPAPAGGPAGG